MSSLSDHLWIAACEVIKWHNKGNDRCIDTLNRLWRKHPEVIGPNGEKMLDVPVLTEDMLAVTLEHWSLQELTALRRSHDRARPLAFPPIVVLHWFDRDFLVDGTTRINLWSQVQNAGPHAVLKLGPRGK